MPKESRPMQLKVRFTHAQWAELQGIAEAEGIPVNVWARRCLLLGLRDPKSQRPKTPIRGIVLNGASSDEPANERRSPARAVGT
jgi:hypothetical protein